MSAIIAPQDAVFLRDLVRERSGIDLGEDKNYLLESRLLPVARDLGQQDIAGLTQYIRSSRDEGAIRQLVEALTTNETSFFRDPRVFTALKEVILPGIANNVSSTTVHIWCAACSSGQEPYSIAIHTQEHPELFQGKKVHILATDIDTTILARAESGIYGQFEVQRGLPVMSLMKYFTQLQEGAGDRWQAKETIRQLVHFKPLNLLADSYTSLGNFPLVMCRNVLIYFKPEIKSAILNRMAQIIPSGGVLVLGTSETTNGLCDQFTGYGEGTVGIFRRV